MDDQSLFLPPHIVARELDISSATLRRWSDEFAEYLSKEAASAEERSHRRYTESDVSTLSEVKQFVNNGMTYEQVRQELASQPVIVEESQDGSPSGPEGGGQIDSGPHEFEIVEQLEVEDSSDKTDFEEEMALIASNGETPGLSFLTNTIATLSDGQKSILNSQAANRELLGVLIQDNFNLKEENNRLRERVLEVERDISKIRQEEEWRRESLRQELDSKIASIQHLANQALVAAQNVEMPEIKAVREKSGCLGALFGGGETRIVTTPRRRNREAGEAPRSQTAARASRPQPSNTSEPPQAYPKPSYPPE